MLENECNPFGDINHWGVLFCILGTCKQPDPETFGRQESEVG